MKPRLHAKPALGTKTRAPIRSIDWLYFLAAISGRAFAPEWSGRRSGRSFDDQPEGTLQFETTQLGRFAFGSAADRLSDLHAHRAFHALIALPRDPFLAEFFGDVLHGFGVFGFGDFLRLGAATSPRRTRSQYAEIFARLAVALASEVARPPRRPRACAASFAISAGADFVVFDALAAVRRDGNDRAKRIVLAGEDFRGESLARFHFGGVVVGEVFRNGRFEAFGLDGVAGGFVGETVVGVRGGHFGFQFLVCVSGISPSIYGDITKRLVYGNRKVKVFLRRPNRSLLAGRAAGAGVGRKRPDSERKKYNAKLSDCD